MEPVGLRFTKMHGCGNDFIVFDHEDVAGYDLPQLAAEVCDRHFGVGADGILVPAPSGRADLCMIYYNSDGSYSEMCGNGIRCLARYARDRGIVDADVIEVETGSGNRMVTLEPDGSSTVDMGPPVVGDDVDADSYTFMRVSMGNPHAVTFLENKPEIEHLNLAMVGPRVELDRKLFPEGTNVEFVHVRGTHDIRMRIWERGAGETLASGSGSCAAAVASIDRGYCDSPLAVHLDGGTVNVRWRGRGESVYMSGPAEYVCVGEFRSA